MFKEILSTLIELFLIFVFVFIPIRLFIFEPFIVIGESMEPNFHNSDYLIVCKICTKLKKPERFEVIVFIPPVDKKKYYIKRIIGLPNEKVIIKDNNIFILKPNSSQPIKISEPYLRGERFYMEDTEFSLGSDEYFVLGDNRDESFDSRKWNKPLKEKDIVGKVIFKVGLFKKFIDILRPNNI